MKRFRLLFFAFTLAIGVVAAVPAGAAVDGSEPVTTVAGTGISGSSADQLNVPRGVAFDADGNLYVADRDNHRVQRVDNAGGTTTVAGGNGAGAATNQLDQPSGLAFDSEGNLYIVDRDNHRVQQLAPDDTITTVAGGNGAGSDANQLNLPRDIVVDSDDNLYIADTDNHRVQKVTPTGQVTTVAGGNGAGSDANQLNFPEGIGIDALDNIYVADAFNNRVQKIAPDLTVTTVAGGNGAGSNANQLSNPFDAAVDAEGAVYVADNFNHRIQKVAAGVTDSTATTVAGNGTSGNAAGQLSFPERVSFDADGSLYISDSANARVQKLTADDTTDPTITVTGLEDGAVLENGVAVELDFECADEGTADLDTCTATLDGQAILDGADLDTETVASHVLVVTATDTAGNEATTTINYRVAGPRELLGEYSGSSGVNGTVARLYMAVFARQPDGPGHTYWVATEAAGDATIDDIAQLFVLSEEFQITYGDLTDEAFVDLLYQNVLGRDGDPGGVEYWNGILDGGAPRSNVVLWFSESQEFKNLTMTS